MRKEQRISTDKFGNQYVLKRTVIGKSKGELNDKFQHVYVELGNKLYKIDISEAQKDKKYENTGDYWVKVTAVKKRIGGSL